MKKPFLFATKRLLTCASVMSHESRTVWKQQTRRLMPDMAQILLRISEVTFFKILCGLGNLRKSVFSLNLLNRVP